jgi:hypothetical protein
MTKTITLKILSSPEQSSDCEIEASIQASNLQEPISSVFTFSSLTHVLDNFARWKESLRDYIPVRREQFRGSAIAYRKTQRAFHLSEIKAYQDCNSSMRELVDSFDRCLNNDNFQNWLRSFFETTTDSVRVIIQTDSLEVATLPWEQWSFWDKYYDTNNLAIVLNFINSAKFVFSAPPKTEATSTRILVLLGDETSQANRINLDLDRKEFQKFETDLKKLGDRTNVDIHIVQPNRVELEQCLQETWHIIYYGGHSETLDAEKDGILYLRDQTQVKISELEISFKEALERGELRLLIVNACQGLGTALRLVSLGLPHVIVMRESIPDDVAHDFLRYFLESLIIGLPVTSAIQHCKPNLRQAYDLRHQLPGASLLPVLCLTLDAVSEVDTPMIPLTGIHPICQEMRALANLAKARLTLENADNIAALKVQEHYANLLQLKNKVSQEDCTTEIELEHCSLPRILGKLMWEVDFLATVQGQTLIWGQGFVNMKSGNSELLLDVRPWSWTGALMTLEGQAIKQLSLNPNAKILLNSESQKASFTKLALLMLEREYRNFMSGYAHLDYAAEVQNFGGWLKDVNKKKFLKHLVILQSQGISDIEAQRQAYLKTPFGKARYELGITDFTVKLPEETFLPLSQIMQQDEWTEQDKQDLRQEGITQEFWSKCQVPQYIVVSIARRGSKMDSTLVKNSLQPEYLS